MIIWKYKIYQSDRLRLKPLVFEICQLNNKNNCKNYSKIDSKNNISINAMGVLGQKHIQVDIKRLI